MMSLTESSTPTEIYTICETYSSLSSFASRLRSVSKVQRCVWSYSSKHHCVNTDEAFARHRLWTLDPVEYHRRRRQAVARTTDNEMHTRPPAATLRRASSAALMILPRHHCHRRRSSATACRRLHPRCLQPRQPLLSSSTPHPHGRRQNQISWNASHSWKLSSAAINVYPLRSR